MDAVSNTHEERQTEIAKEELRPLGLMTHLLVYFGFALPVRTVLLHQGASEEERVYAFRCRNCARIAEDHPHGFQKRNRRLICPSCGEQRPL